VWPLLDMLKVPGGTELPLGGRGGAGWLYVVLDGAVHSWMALGRAVREAAQEPCAYRAERQQGTFIRLSKGGPGSHADTVAHRPGVRDSASSVAVSAAGTLWSGIWEHVDSSTMHVSTDEDSTLLRLDMTQLAQAPCAVGRALLALLLQATATSLLARNARVVAHESLSLAITPSAEEQLLVGLSRRNSGAPEASGEAAAHFALNPIGDASEPPLSRWGGSVAAALATASPPRPTPGYLARHS